MSLLACSDAGISPMKIDVECLLSAYSSVNCY